MATLEQLYARPKPRALCRREQLFLMSCKYEDRVVPWKHKAAMDLFGLGLVTRVRETPSTYRVRATPLGIYTDTLRDGVPVPTEVPDGWEPTTVKMANPLRPNLETAHG
jgi:hypothetical protein